jgi:hypothetical protein
MSRFIVPIAAFVVLTSVALRAADEAKDPPPKELEGLPLLVNEDFNLGTDSLNKFTFTDRNAWRVGQDVVRGQEKHVMSQFLQSKYEPKVRSPFNQAWLKEPVVGPFIMEVRLRSTAVDSPRRDMCLFFGGVDASHFLYAHIAKKADEHHHNVFLVDGADRAAIATKISEGVPWDDDYHTIRLSRDDKANIKVYWENELILAAKSDKFPAGRLGVGTFDDTGVVAQITVWGKKVEKK